MIDVTITMSDEDMAHLPCLTTTDVREFIESFGLKVGRVSMVNVNNARRHGSNW